MAPVGNSSADAHANQVCKPDERFGRSRRLNRPRLFDEAFADSRGFAGRYVVLRARRRADACGRAGVVASKRTFRRAVDRNRAKRLMREAFRKCREQLSPNVDVVLVARRRILEAGCRDVEAEMVRLATRAGMGPKR